MINSCLEVVLIAKRSQMLKFQVTKSAEDETNHAYI